MVKGEVITVERALKKLGLADEYLFNTGRHAIALRVDKKTGEWTVYVGKIDQHSLDVRIIPEQTLELSFDEGVGVIKVLRVNRAYFLGFEVAGEREE